MPAGSGTPRACAKCLDRSPHSAAEARSAASPISGRIAPLHAANQNKCVPWGFERFAGRRAGGGLGFHPPSRIMSAGNDSPSHIALTTSPLTTISIHQQYPELPRVHSRNDSSSKPRLGKHAVCSATPLIACPMPYLAGDEGRVGSLRRKCHAFFPPFLSVPRSPDISSRQTVHPATPLHAHLPASN